jgi:hypothetical protein
MGLLNLYLSIEYLQVYIITVTHEYLKCATSMQFAFVIPKVIQYKIRLEKQTKHTNISNQQKVVREFNLRRTIYVYLKITFFRNVMAPQWVVGLRRFDAT